MRQPATRADWLVEQSQQHFQKLASLAIRAEGAQRMGRLEAQQVHHPPNGGISKLGHVRPQMTKVAINSINIFKSIIGAGKAAESAGEAVAKGAKSVGSVARAAEAVKPVSSAVRAAEAVKPVGSSLEAAKSVARVPKAPVPRSGAVAPAAGHVGVTPPPRGPATHLFAQQTGDSANIKAAKMMAKARGVSDVDAYADMLGQIYPHMRPSAAESAAKSLATGAATPASKAGASAAHSQLGRVSTLPVASNVSAVKGPAASSVAATPRAPQPLAGPPSVAPAPAPAPGAGPYRAGGGTPIPPTLLENPAPSISAGAEEALSSAAAPAAPAAGKAFPWGKALLGAGLIGGGLAVGGTALGVGQAIAPVFNRSGAPYAYGMNAPMPGMYPQQM